MPFQFLHAADIHLDSPLRGLDRYEGAPAEKIRQVTRRALENLVALAIQRQVAFVVVAGDLYDGDWKEFRTGLFFVGQMVRLREAGIPVYVIAGNHDAANKMTRRLPLPGNVHVFSADEPETLRLDDWGVAIHGQSFARGAVTENLALGYPAAVPGMFNLGILHTAAGCEGHDPYAPCTVEDLKSKHYDYWALGHIHQRQTLCDDPPIVFSGNLQGRHIRETGPKGCLLVTVDGHRVGLEPCWLDVLRWEHCRVDVSGAADADEVIQRIREQLAAIAAQADGRQLAIRVTVAGRTAAHRNLVAEPLRWTGNIRALAQDVGGGDLWLEKVTLQTAPPADAGPALADDSPMGELLSRVAELQADPNRLAALPAEFSELWDKLPAELREGADGLGLERPERLGQLLEDVQQLLIQQLLAREDRA
jgi:DNA repair exonuclease SbcCD nuclease subunit